MKDRKLGVAPPFTLQAQSSVAVTSDCSSVVVRARTGEASGDAAAASSEALSEFDISADGSIGAARDYAVPKSLAGFVQPSFPLLQPALSAAVDRLGGVTRVAWLVPQGLAAGDLGADEVTPLLPPSDGPAPANRPPPPPPLFFTGVDTTGSNIRLAFSPSTQFLLLTQQRGFAGRPQFRIFDLRTKARAERLANAHGQALRDEACRVAAIVGVSTLTGIESRAWAGNESATQVCNGSKAGQRS